MTYSTFFRIRNPSIGCHRSVRVFFLSTKNRWKAEKKIHKYHSVIPRECSFENLLSDGQSRDNDHKKLFQIVNRSSHVRLKSHMPANKLWYLHLNIHMEALTMTPPYAALLLSNAILRINSFWGVSIGRRKVQITRTSAMCTYVKEFRLIVSYQWNQFDRICWPLEK